MPDAAIASDGKPKPAIGCDRKREGCLARQNVSGGLCLGLISRARNGITHNLKPRDFLFARSPKIFI